jgi:hypothetical protein
MALDKGKTADPIKTKTKNMTKNFSKMFKVLLVKQKTFILSSLVGDGEFGLIGKGYSL